MAKRPADSSRIGGAGARAIAIANEAAALEAGREMEAVAETVQTMDGTEEPKPRVLSPLERVELPTGASLGRVFARGWKGRRQRIVVSPAEGGELPYHEPHRGWRARAR